MYKAILLAALLIVSATSSARAGLYDIIFNAPVYSSDPNFSASGSFDYVPGTGFSNFNVIWDGSSYNLTSSANSAANRQLDACQNSLTGAAYTFSVLTACNTATFTNFYNTPDIGFFFQYLSTGSFLYSSVYLGGPSHARSSNFNYAAGLYVYRPDISFPGGYSARAGFNVIKVPEPSSIVLLGSAIIALLGLQAMRRHQRKA
ncbi:MULTISPECIES: PEP-CTERM sorting domain-containing protein [Acidiphilium]|uniref:PEP-CTERM protein-sorting domain-containing protein n=1 Tax=Acidiphilium rubrum TaxID=526 RepID=A0A8G2CK20_ACIRU|nr:MULTISPECIES: PEP-CTERM sorting domain-containing protein [Acidiphilium]SIQ65156.1 PEP-CTERM protein-sorting domain-containing protein [Acidiphilium rubrum]